MMLGQVWGRLRTMRRRDVLRTGMLGGLLLAVGGIGFLGRETTLPIGPFKHQLKVLSEREFAVLQAITGRMIPPHPLFPSAEKVNCVLNADSILARTSFDSQAEVKKLLNLFEVPLISFLFEGNLHPFTRLTPTTQDQRLRGWQNSRIALRRTGFQALRSLVMASYYASPLTWEGMGYAGPPAGFFQP